MPLRDCRCESAPPETQKFSVALVSSPRFSDTPLQRRRFVASSYLHLGFLSKGRGQCERRMISILQAKEKERPCCFMAEPYLVFLPSEFIFFVVSLAATIVTFLKQFPTDYSKRPLGNCSSNRKDNFGRINEGHLKTKLLALFNLPAGRELWRFGGAV